MFLIGIGLFVFNLLLIQWLWTEEIDKPDDWDLFDDIRR